MTRRAGDPKRSRLRRGRDGSTQHLSEREDAASVTAPPIFILAALPRSGTNFLWELLRRHPDCVPARSPIWEDYLLKNASHLKRAADAIQRSWDPVWGSTDDLRPQLLTRLGDALIDFLSTDSRRRTVTKSPTIANLDLFFEVFPRAHLLLLVRDGRDVAASGMKTFGWTLEQSARSWSSGARRMARFVDEHPDAAVRVVRFEDIVLDTERTLMEVLSFLGLSRQAYDLDALEDVPVRGSSTYLGPGRSEINWEVLSKPSDFTPIGRWGSWSSDELALFEAVAGSQMERFGYASSSASVG